MVMRSALVIGMPASGGGIRQFRTSGGMMSNQLATCP
jgi:hypothetical protein